MRDSIAFISSTLFSMRFSADFNRLSRMSISRWRDFDLLAAACKPLQDRALGGRDLRLGLVHLDHGASGLVSGAAGFGVLLRRAMGRSRDIGVFLAAVGKFRFSCAQDFLIWLGW